MNKNSSKGFSDISSPKKAHLSTKFSSSKLVKENDFTSFKNLEGFEKIEELPESSINSSMQVSSRFYSSKKKLGIKASSSKGNSGFYSI